MILGEYGLLRVATGWFLGKHWLRRFAPAVLLPSVSRRLVGVWVCRVRHCHGSNLRGQPSAGRQVLLLNLIALWNS